MSSRHFSLVLVASVLLLASPAVAAEAALERQFESEVRPFLGQYCVGCHGGASPVAQFSVEAYASVDAVVSDHRHWALILERLAAGEMPPKSAPQPDRPVRRQVIAWIESLRDEVARRQSGDPGPVLVRRLSNAEYNYTVRDLTGVDIRPAREFPVDPANPAGFDNSGESLLMSPALLAKYLQAAREVGEHLVLTPDGFGFAPHPMVVVTDREKYAIRRIVEFYDRQPTDFAEYFEAAWRFKHRAALGSPGDSMADVARKARVSSGYLPTVWQLLEGSEDDFGPLAELRAMWRALPEASEVSSRSLRARCATSWSGFEGSSRSSSSPRMWKVWPLPPSR